MRRPAPVHRVPLTCTALGALLGLSSCQGHAPKQPERPSGPPEATALGAFDPSAIGPGAPPRPAPARPLDVADYGPIGKVDGVLQVHVRFNQPVVPLELP